MATKQASWRRCASKDNRFCYFSRSDWAIRPGGRLAGDDLPAFGPPTVQAALAAACDDDGAEADPGCAVGPR